MNKKFNKIMKNVANNNQNKIEYDKFRNAISEAFSTYVSNISSDAKFLIESTDDFVSYSDSDKCVKINEDVIKNIYRGNKSYLYIILSEIYYFKMKCDYINGDYNSLKDDFTNDVVSDNFFKDMFINDSYNQELYNYAYDYNDVKDKYLKDNYNLNPGRLTSNSRACLDMVCYYASIGESFSDEEIYKIKKYIKNYNNKLNENKRVYDGYIVYLDDLYLGHINKNVLTPNRKFDKNNIRKIKKKD